MDVRKRSSSSMEPSDNPNNQRQDRQQPIILQNFELLSQNHLKFRRKSLSTANLYLSAASLRRQVHDTVSDEVSRTLNHGTERPCTPADLQTFAHQTIDLALRTQVDSFTSPALQTSRNQGVRKQVTFADIPATSHSVPIEGQTKVSPPLTKATSNLTKRPKGNIQHHINQNRDVLKGGSAGYSATLTDKRSPKLPQKHNLSSKTAPKSTQNQSSSEQKFKQLNTVSSPANTIFLDDKSSSLSSYKPTDTSRMCSNNSSREEETAAQPYLTIANKEANVITQKENNVFKRVPECETINKTLVLDFSERVRTACTDETVFGDPETRASRSKRVSFQLLENRHINNNGSNSTIPVGLGADCDIGCNVQTLQSESISTSKKGESRPSQNEWFVLAEFGDVASSTQQLSFPKIKISSSISNCSTLSAQSSRAALPTDLRRLPETCVKSSSEINPFVESNSKKHLFPTAITDICEPLSHTVNKPSDKTKIKITDNYHSDEENAHINIYGFELSTEKGKELAVKRRLTVVNDSTLINETECYDVVRQPLQIKELSASEFNAEFLLKIYSSSEDNIHREKAFSRKFDTDSVIETDNTPTENKQSTSRSVGNITDSIQIKPVWDPLAKSVPERLRSAVPLGRYSRNSVSSDVRYATARGITLDNQEMVPNGENYMFKTNRRTSCSLEKISAAEKYLLKADSSIFARTRLNRRLEDLIVQNLHLNKPKVLLERARTTL